MPLPASQTFSRVTRDQIPQNRPHATFLFGGSEFKAATEAERQVGAPETAITAVNVFGKKHEGEHVVCVEKVITGSNGVVTQALAWMTEGEYAAEHRGLWQKYDMEPNREFNVGEGLRSEGGEHLGGANELCERDGTLKPANIRARCA